MESFITEPLGILSTSKIEDIKNDVQKTKLKYVKYFLTSENDSVSFKITEKLNNDINNIFE